MKHKSVCIVGDNASEFVDKIVLAEPRLSITYAIACESVLSNTREAGENLYFNIADNDFIILIGLTPETIYALGVAVALRKDVIWVEEHEHPQAIFHFGISVRCLEDSLIDVLRAM